MLWLAAGGVKCEVPWPPHSFTPSARHLEAVALATTYPAALFRGRLPRRARGGSHIGAGTMTTQTHLGRLCISDLKNASRTVRVATATPPPTMPTADPPAPPCRRLLLAFAACAAGFVAPASPVAVRSAAVAAPPAVYMASRPTPKKAAKRVAPKKVVKKVVKKVAKKAPPARRSVAKQPEKKSFSFGGPSKPRATKVAKKAGGAPARKATGLGAGNDLFNGIGMAFQLLGSMGDSSKVTQAERSARTR